MNTTGVSSKSILRFVAATACLCFAVVWIGISAAAEKDELIGNGRRPAVIEHGVKPLLPQRFFINRDKIQSMATLTESEPLKPPTFRLHLPDATQYTTFSLPIKLLRCGTLLEEQMGFESNEYNSSGCILQPAPFCFANTQWDNTLDRSALKLDLRGSVGVIDIYDTWKIRNLGNPSLTPHTIIGLGEISAATAFGCAFTENITGAGGFSLRLSDSLPVYGFAERELAASGRVLYHFSPDSHLFLKDGVVITPSWRVSDSSDGIYLQKYYAGLGYKLGLNSIEIEYIRENGAEFIAASEEWMPAENIAIRLREGIVFDSQNPFIPEGTWQSEGSVEYCPFPRLSIGVKAKVNGAGTGKLGSSGDVTYGMTAGVEYRFGDRKKKECEVKTNTVLSLVQNSPVKLNRVSSLCSYFFSAIGSYQEFLNEASQYISSEEELLRNGVYWADILRDDYYDYEVLEGKKKHPNNTPEEVYYLAREGNKTVGICADIHRAVAEWMNEIARLKGWNFKAYFVCLNVIDSRRGNISEHSYVMGVDSKGRGFIIDYDQLNSYNTAEPQKMLYHRYLTEEDFIPLKTLVFDPHTGDLLYTFKSGMYERINQARGSIEPEAFSANRFLVTGQKPPPFQGRG